MLGDRPVVATPDDTELAPKIITSTLAMIIRELFNLDYIKMEKIIEREGNLFESRGRRIHVHQHLEMIEMTV
jgi:hypothetical protein